MPKFIKGVPRPAGAGRKKGSTNIVTREIRSIMQQILENSSDELECWLHEVAQNDPAKALELYLKISEFCIPKLQRTEHAGNSANLTIQAILKEIDGKTAGLPKPEWFQEGAPGWGAKLPLID